MKRLLIIGFVLALAGCGAETGSDSEACQVYTEVDPLVRGIDPQASYPMEQEDTYRQLEFRLAEASVLATDHELSVALRTLADKAGNVVEHPADQDTRQLYIDQAGAVAKLCK